MSSDSTSSVRADRRGFFSGQTVNSPRTILLIVICSVVALVVLRWTVFRPLADAAQMAVDNKHDQEKLKKRLDLAEQDASLTEQQLGTLTSQWKAKDVDLKAMLTRVEKMQAAFLETAEEIEQVKWLAKDVEAAKARSLAGARRIKARAAPVQAKLTELRRSLQVWDKQVAPLFENEAGRRIAASPQHLKRFLLVPQKPSVTATQVADWEQALSALLTPVNRALSQDKGAFRTLDEHLAELEKLATDIDRAAASLSKDIQAARRLTADTQAIAAGKQTLAQALQTLRADRAQADEDALIASSQTAHDRAMVEAKRVLAEAAKRVVAADQEVQLQKKKHAELEKQAEAEQLRHTNDALAKALARSKLLAEFKTDLPEINRLLRSFMTPALVKISERGFSRTGNRVRMSLARIKGFGAMKNSDEGLERLHYLGGSTTNWREDHGSFPAYSKRLIRRDENVRKQVRRAQELLAKYGDILVEKGLLSE